jgi:hypothetical protein
MIRQSTGLGGVILIAVVCGGIGCATLTTSDCGMSYCLSRQDGTAAAGPAVCGGLSNTVAGHRVRKIGLGNATMMGLDGATAVDQALCRGLGGATATILACEGLGSATVTGVACRGLNGATVTIKSRGGLVLDSGFCHLANTCVLAK